MPAVSKTQQRLFGQVLAYRKGNLDTSKINKTRLARIKKLADTMSLKDIKKFASTKHDKLPEVVKESRIMSWKSFNESLMNTYIWGRDIMESLTVWHDTLVDAVNAVEVDFTQEFSYVPENTDMERLSQDATFFNSLSSIGMKVSEMETLGPKEGDIGDHQTFLNKPCRFMTVHQLASDRLEKPDYILLQPWNETQEKWDRTRLYRVQGDMAKFYEKLTSRTVEIKDDEGEVRIYSTSNTGNDWVLQQPEKENTTFRKIMRREELQELLDRDTISVRVI
jgi:hypothetical protein